MAFRGWGMIINLFPKHFNERAHVDHAIASLGEHALRGLRQGFPSLLFPIGLMQRQKYKMSINAELDWIKIAKGDEIQEKNQSDKWETGHCRNRQKPNHSLNRKYKEYQSKVNPIEAFWISFFSFSSWPPCGSVLPLISLTLINYQIPTHPLKPISKSPSLGGLSWCPQKKWVASFPVKFLLS